LFPEFHRAVDFHLLDGGGRIDVLGADFRTGAHEGAIPDTVMIGQDIQPLGFALVA